MIRDAVFFDESNEIGRRVSRQRGFREVLVGADEILGPAVDVREIAAPASGNQNFLADAVGALQYGDSASSFASFCGAQESRGASAEDESVKFVRW